jgi:hypothetical protein
MNGYFKDAGLKRSYSKKFQFYLSAKAKAKLVAYNGALQGGLFTASTHEVGAKDMERLVYTGYLSAVMACKRLSLEFQKVYTTREFAGGTDHGWGRCALTWCF